MPKFRKLPVEIEAMQWLGGDTAPLDHFCVQFEWTRADARDLGWSHDDSEEVVVWNHLSREWLPIPVGSWIIRGTVGELYPCDAAVFAETYEAVTAAPKREKWTTIFGLFGKKFRLDGIGCNGRKAEAQIYLTELETDEPYTIEIGWLLVDEDFSFGVSDKRLSSHDWLDDELIEATTDA